MAPSTRPSPRWASRAELNDAGLDGTRRSSVLRYQRELFVVGAELATNPAAVIDCSDGVTRVSEEMLNGVEAELRALGGAHGDAARVRRARRDALRRPRSRSLVRPFAGPSDASSLQSSRRARERWLLPYVNRLADLMWVLARAPSRPSRRPRHPPRKARASSATTCARPRKTAWSPLACCRAGCQRSAERWRPDAGAPSGIRGSVLLCPGPPEPEATAQPCTTPYKAQLRPLDGDGKVRDARHVGRRRPLPA